jgi:hypothetical protein
MKLIIDLTQKETTKNWTTILEDFGCVKSQGFLAKILGDYLHPTKSLMATVKSKGSKLIISDSYLEIEPLEAQFKEHGYEMHKKNELADIIWGTGRITNK